MNRTGGSVVVGLMKAFTKLAAVAAATVLFVACSGSGADSTTVPADSGPDSEITIADFAFSGVESVNVGDTVEVTNNDSVSHTWTADDDTFDSGALATGDTFEFTFEEPGEYSFFCSFHPQMTGTITVEG